MSSEPSANPTSEKLSALLREALALARDSEGVFLEVQIARALGHVINQEKVRRSTMKGSLDLDRTDDEALYGSDDLLHYRILKALVMADALKEQRVAICLNDALVHLTGSGVVPVELPSEESELDEPSKR